MSDSALIQLGELTKPATILIEKVSDAVGGLFRPWQIRRVAEAEAEAEKIKAISKIEITDLQYRSINRLFIEESKKQTNMEEITRKALPELSEQSRPKEVDDDWITHFFDKCRLISDEKMQLLWAKVLAGEANSPGKFSKRTVSLLSSIDKSDAELFASLCSFSWHVLNMVPLIYDVQHSVYSERGVKYISLKHLDDIGLISFNGITSYQLLNLPQRLPVFYCDRPILIEFKKSENNIFDMGHVSFSKCGLELAALCPVKENTEFKDYVIERWRAFGYNITVPEVQFGDSANNGATSPELNISPKKNQARWS